MSLASGTRIGPYEIIGVLGAGGMGEVYRARDARLVRDVALKVLPEAFAADPERLARFQREAQVLAALKQPNIGAIYGLEEVSPTAVGAGFSRPMQALVLERQHFLIPRPVASLTQDAPPPIAVVLNWAQGIQH